MDTYSKLLLGNQLFPIDAIEHFGKRHPKWYNMSGREKASLMLHVMICMLLCNKKKTVDHLFARKRKGKEVQGETSENLDIVDLETRKLIRVRYSIASSLKSSKLPMK
ncbi:unnamed protein product [Pieris macdunnoughi]|uniref:Uncharacterized protein n=1 Tax=Pieris macdunnoughi TaxID=345717 RepID=A0A821XNV0_9NEOP|nr:unnamed protein product [Pieris macdunnoughi]